MDLTGILSLNLGVIAGLMTLLWLLSIPLKDVSIVDIFWGAGFAVVAWVTFSQTASSGPSRWLLPVLTTIWSTRLTLYLAWRNLGHGEDKRYAAMRARRGPIFALTSIYVVFGLQGAVMWTVSLPLQAGITLAEPGWTWLHAVGITCWSFGILFETFGDLQLSRFKANPDNAGKVLNTGLWRYTRHPNYFGDFLLWWGLYAIAAAHGAALWSAVGPVVMSVFLMRISGVTLLEQSLKETRPGYREYIQNTNAFFPWFPSRSADS